MSTTDQAISATDRADCDGGKTKRASQRRRRLGRGREGRRRPVVRRYRDARPRRSSRSTTPPSIAGIGSREAAANAPLRAAR